VPGAILFDLYETLVTESAAPPPGVSSLAPELGCERDAFRALWKRRRPAVAVGRLSFREALETIAAELGGRPDPATLDRLCADRVRAKAAPFERIDPAVLGGVRQLSSRGVRLCVVSNGFAEDVAAWPRSSLAPYFGCAVFSCEVGLAKPDPAIYHEAVGRLGIGALDAWFVGDGMDGELDGAARVGLRAIQACWFLRRWPHFREASCGPGGLDRIDDLLAMVDSR